MFTLFTSPITVLKVCFRSRFRHVRCDPQSGVVQATFRGLHGELVTQGCWDADLRLLQVYCVLPLVVPAPKTAALAMAVSRANERRRVGCFELDIEDGRIAFYSYSLVEQRVCRSLVEKLLEIAIRSADPYVPAFRRVIRSGDESPVDSIDGFEAAQEQSRQSSPQFHCRK